MKWLNKILELLDSLFNIDRQVIKWTILKPSEGTATTSSLATQNWSWKEVKLDINTLKLVLDRVWYTKYSTIGELSIDGKFECYILEDYDRLRHNRRKKHGETAIPRGTYEVRLTYSSRFKKTLPLLISVPRFRGIRIHAGNTAKDTEGCLLPGTTRSENSVGQSKRAFNKLFKKLEKAKRENKQITIEVKE